MRDRTFHWLARIRDVEREHTAIRFAIEHLLQSVQGGATALKENLKRLDLNRASTNLEFTYTIRLFAEFEAGLKRFLKSKKLKVPRNARRLIDRVAARIGIAGDLLLNVHKVRDCRNRFAHDLEQEVEPLTIRKATSFLCTFFDRLQTAW